MIAGSVPRPKGCWVSRRRRGAKPTVEESAPGQWAEVKIVYYRAEGYTAATASSQLEST